MALKNLLVFQYRRASAWASGVWTFCDFSGKGGDRHSCLSNSFLKQLKAGKNACLYPRASARGDRKSVGQTADGIIF
jgi:hypothetical protein